MKKVLVFILAITMVTSLFGCGKELPHETQATTETATEPVTEPSTESPTEPATEPSTEAPMETPGEPVQVRRISKVNYLNEDVTFIYEDKQSPKVTILLQGSPYLSSTFYPGGQVKTEERYNNHNQISRIYEYNEQGQLVSEYSPEQHAPSFTLEYTYTPEGLPDTVRASAEGYPSQIIKKWVYDDQGRALEYEDSQSLWMHNLDPYGDDPITRETWVYDQNGQVIDYNQYQNGTLVIHKQQSYDSQGNVVTDLKQYFNEGLEQLINNEYSDQGLLTRAYKKETRDGQTITSLSEYRYNKQQKKIGCTHTWSSGEVFEESWTYDKQGVLRESITYTFDYAIQKFIDLYNKQGLMTEQTIISYDAKGKLYHTSLLRQDYDRQGNLLKKEYYDNDKWVSTETSEYDQGKLVYFSCKDWCNGSYFQRRHYDDTGNLIDISTEKRQSLTEGTDTLITMENNGHEVFLAITYEESTVMYSDAAVWQTIDQYIIQKLTERG